MSIRKAMLWLLLVAIGVACPGFLGLTADNTLPINQTITYYLRLNNNTGYSAEGVANEFRIYSPDGVTTARQGAGN